MGIKCISSQNKHIYSFRWAGDDPFYAKKRVRRKEARMHGGRSVIIEEIIPKRRILPMFRFNHFNFNVRDLNTSLDFYKKALGLNPIRTVDTDAFNLVFLGDGNGTFSLELTYIKGRTEAYDIGEAEFHLALTAEDMAAARKLHEEMGCVVFVNEQMGIYFIEDPDGYWIEIIPAK
jgi:lactoylglutathione lyase